MAKDPNTLPPAPPANRPTQRIEKGTFNDSGRPPQPKPSPPAPKQKPKA